MAKEKDNNGSDGASVADAEKKKKAEEREKYERRKMLESLAPEFFALFGRTGTDLLEVARVTDRQKVLNSVQIMMEELGNPLRVLRASAVLREADLHGSIGINGQGREDIHLLYKGKVEAQAAKGGEAFG
jgi:hypothetical protein